MIHIHPLNIIYIHYISYIYIHYISYISIEYHIYIYDYISYLDAVQVKLEYEYQRKLVSQSKHSQEIKQKKKNKNLAFTKKNCGIFIS